MTNKTTKELIAEGWKLELIPVQHMFPNCNIRYKTKCTDMKSCDKDAMDKIEDLDIQSVKAIKKIKIIKDIEPIIGKAPKYFREDIERVKRSKV